MPHPSGYVEVMAQSSPGADGLVECCDLIEELSTLGCKEAVNAIVLIANFGLIFDFLNFTFFDNTEKKNTK